MQQHAAAHLPPTQYAAPSTPGKRRREPQRAGEPWPSVGPGARASTSAVRGRPRPAEAPDVVPVVVEWKFGGSAVAVAGAWDGWRAQTPLHRDAPSAPFVAVLYLPLGGAFQFKYLVDGAWQCSPSVPTETDAAGNTNNMLTVTPPDLDFAPDAVSPSTSPPRSPQATYDSVIPDANTAASRSSDPPHLPAAAGADLPEPPSSRALIGHLALDGGRARPAPMMSAAGRPTRLIPTTHQVAQQSALAEARSASDAAAAGLPPPTTMAFAFRYKLKVVTAIYVSSGVVDGSSSGIGDRDTVGGPRRQ